MGYISVSGIAVLPHFVTQNTTRSMATLSLVNTRMFTVPLTLCQYERASIQTPGFSVPGSGDGYGVDVKVGVGVLLGTVVSVDVATPVDVLVGVLDGVALPAMVLGGVGAIVTDDIAGGTAVSVPTDVVDGVSVRVLVAVGPGVFVAVLVAVVVGVGAIMGSTSPPPCTPGATVPTGTSYYS